MHRSRLSIRVALGALITGIAHGALAVACERPLTDESFRAIPEGASESEVLARIGPPSAKQRLHAGTLAWVYRYLDTWGYEAEFGAVFDANGTLVQKAFTRQNG
jgi:hypothetical protein